VFVSVPVGTKHDKYLKLRRSMFTSSSAFVREVLELLAHTKYKLSLEIWPKDVERLEAELEGISTMGRLKVKVRQEKSNGDR
jgi:hypothetical protein